MVCVTAGFGDNATTCAELCRELFFFLSKKKRRGRCEKGRLSKKQNCRSDGKTGELQEFSFPSCCHTSDMQNRRHVCEDSKKSRRGKIE